MTAVAGVPLILGALGDGWLPADHVAAVAVPAVRAESPANSRTASFVAMPDHDIPWPDVAMQKIVGVQQLQPRQDVCCDAIEVHLVGRSREPREPCRHVDAIQVFVDTVDRAIGFECTVDAHDRIVLVTRQPLRLAQIALLVGVERLLSDFATEWDDGEVLISLRSTSGKELLHDHRNAEGEVISPVFEAERSLGRGRLDDVIRF